MLTSRFKSEEQKRLDQVLQTSLLLEFVPDQWDGNQRRQLDNVFLKTIDLSVEILIKLTPGQLIDRVNDSALSADNIEGLADLLLKAAAAEHPDRPQLAERAKAIYANIQSHSKTFSMSMVQKIEEASAYL